MELLLVRHTAVDVPEGHCYGQTDVPLRTTFEQEAAEVARRLRSEAPFGAVYTSPLSRCTRLAQACGHGDARRDDRLMELNFGQWEMQPWENLPGNGSQEWFDDWVHTPAPGGESFLDQYRRVGAFLDELSEQRVLVFAHGGVIACARALLEGLPLEESFREMAPYGAVVRFSK